MSYALPNSQTLAEQLDLNAAGCWCDPKQAFVDGDGAKFVGSTENGRETDLFVDNYTLLRKRGIYEPSLVSALTSGKTTWAEWPLPFLLYLLGIADRALRGRISHETWPSGSLIA